MINIPQKENEDRKTYLVRLAVAYINEALDKCFDESIFYDKALGDGESLIDDLEKEFEL